MPRFEPHPERRAAIVTGASSGIGQATAELLGALGYPVVLAARRIDRLKATADAINSKGGEAVALPLDLAEPESIAAFARDAESAVGSIEVLISNAGDVQPITTVGAAPEEFARQMQINLLGAQALAHAVVPSMLQRRRGDVVFVTSEVALQPRTHMAAYVASKAGLEGFAHAMAMECEGTGVRVGIVRPGPSTTEQGTSWSEADVNEVVSSWSHWGFLRHNGALRPQELAHAIRAVIEAPKGTRYAVLEVQPEAPVTTPVDASFSDGATSSTSATEQNSNSQGEPQ